MKKMIAVVVALASISSFAECINHDSYKVCAGNVQVLSEGIAQISDIRIDGYRVKPNKMAQTLTCNAFGYSDVIRKGSIRDSSLRYNLKNETILQTYPSKSTKLDYVICK